MFSRYGNVLLSSVGRRLLCHRFLPAACLALALLGAAPASTSAGIIKFFAHFNHMQQTHPTVGVPDDAWAMAGILYEPTTREMKFNLIYDHLSSALTSLELRGPAMKGVVGPMLQDLTPPNTAVMPMSHTVTLSPQQANDLFDQTLYMNLGTVLNPLGEIRGQICLLTVPEPSTGLLGMLACGAGAALAFARRRSGRFANRPAAT